MSVVAALLFSIWQAATAEPVLCTDLDMNNVSVIEGQVEQRVVRRDQSAGQASFGEIHYEVVARVQPRRTLRGAQVRQAVTTRARCSAPWLDFAGRRFCSGLLQVNEVETFLVDRRTHEAQSDPGRDEVADYDHRMSRPLPRCERQ